MPVGSLTPVTFTERVFMSRTGRVSPTSRPAASVSLDEMIGAASDWTCAEPMLNAGERRPRVTCSPTWRRRLVEALGALDGRARPTARSIACSKTPCRGTSRRAGSARPACHARPPVRHHHRAPRQRVTGRRAHRPLGGALARLAWLLCRRPEVHSHGCLPRPPWPINEGTPSPEASPDKLSDDAGTAYDLAISVSLDTFNQMLAEAGTSEALNLTLDAAIHPVDARPVPFAHRR